MDSASTMRQRLLAILEADGVGYSRLMSIDGPSTVAQLDAAREVFRAEIEAEAGRVVDMAGDSVLAVFETATGAVRAAMAAQARWEAAPSSPAPEDRLRFRIGVHLGDVYEKGDGSVYGDGVNIAARLQSLAAPGTVAVSQSIRTAVHGHVAAGFEDLGERQVKNIAQPVRVFRLCVDGAAGVTLPARWRPGPVGIGLAAAIVLLAAFVGLVAWHPWQAGRAEGATAVAAAPARSLAVLPFASLGDDKSGDMIAEGVSDELLDVLARVPGLRVVSRNSARTFKGQSVTAPEMARLLGVSYLVEGSVRRDGPSVRIAAQLTQGSDGAVLWSETFNREFKDVFAVQAELALLVAQRMKLPLDKASLAGSGTRSAEAWQLVLEGQRRPMAEREGFYRRALELDPKFVRAYLLLANDAFESSAEGVSPRQARDRSMAYLESALRLDPRSAEAYGRMASAESLLDDTPAMRRDARKAIELSPSNVPGLFWSARLAQEAGDMDEALSSFERLAEADPLDAFAQYTYAAALRLAGRPKAALAVVERALALGIGARDGGVLKGMILADLGRRDEARALAHQFDNPWLSTAVATAAELQAMDRRTDLDAHQRAWVDLALGRHAAFVAHAQDHVHDLGWRADALFDPRFDPVRRLPAFAAWLQQCGLTQSHDRAQAWRKANPPERG